MKYDNYQMLMSMAKTLQENGKDNEGAPFLVVCKEEKDSNKSATAIYGKGGDIIDLVGNAFDALIQTLKESGAPVGMATGIASQITMHAVEKHYGMDAILEDAQSMANKLGDMLQGLTEDDEEDDEE